MNQFLNALILSYEAQKATAIAELSVLMQSPVGIGDHTNIVSDMKQKVKEIAEADDCLAIIRGLTSTSQTTPPTPNPGN